MYKILMIDDEGLELQFLQTSLKKHFGDSIEITTGSSGRIAIELYDSIRPDLLLIDIQMPGINGLDAIREIKKIHNDGKFIVITAYDNFEYIQEALSLGVSAYITKPIHFNNLIDEVRKQLNEIDIQKNNKRENLILREKMDAALPMLEAGFIYSILLHEDWNTVCSKYASLIDLNQEAAYFIVTEFQTDFNSENQLLLQNSAGKILSLIKSIFRHSISQQIGNRFLTIVPCNLPDDEYSSRIQSINCSTELSNKLKNLIPLPVSIGIGNIVLLKELSDSHTQAVSALEEKVATVAHVKDLSIEKSWEEGYPQDIEHALFAAVDANDINTVLQKAREFYDWMIYQHSNDKMDIKLKVLELVLRIEHDIFHNNGGMTYHFMERHGYLEDIISIDDYNQLREWFLDRISGALSNIKAERDATNDSNIEQAKEYIKNNYNENLTLTDVSELVHISPYYFSKLFKDKTGKNFIEYLTCVRMEEAMKQLTSSSLSIKEICINVGYSDPNYFSRSFKKYTGKTPGEYRSSQLPGGM